MVDVSWRALTDSKIFVNSLLNKPITQKYYNLLSSVKALQSLALVNSICYCSWASLEIGKNGNSRHWDQGCKAKGYYLLVLLITMLEAW